MKKSITKIVKAVLAVTMAIGMGVSAGLTSNKNVKPVNAYTSSTVFELVTSNSQLVAGSKYIIGATYNTKNYFANKTSNNNNRKLTTASITNNKVVIGESIMPFTLGGSTGAWTFATNDYGGTAGYLNTTNTISSNYLRVVADLDSYAYFSIDISNNDATILCTGKNSKNTMYLYQSGQISCYDNKDGDSNYIKPRLYKELVDASINGNNSVDIGSEWAPTNITENEGSHAVVAGATFSFTPSDGAAISSFNASTGAFIASAAGTVTVSAAKTGYTISDKTVTINPADPYINLALTSDDSLFTGQTVSVSAEYGNGVAGLTWTVQSGSTSSVASSNSGYSAIVGGSTGTLTIRATDTGSALYREVSINVTKVTLSLNKTSTNIGLDCSETLTPTHNASSIGGVNWLSDNAKVSVDNGVITVAEDATIGDTATITATSSVDSSVSVTCTVTIVNEHGTLESDPLTVAEAVAIGSALAKNAETPHDYYVSGIVSRIDYDFSGSPLNATFWLANGESVIEGFQAYRVTLADGRVIDTTDFKVGAEVVIFCKIKKFSNSTIETGSIGEIVSLSFDERPTSSVTLNKTSISLSISDTFTLTSIVLPVYTTSSSAWASSNARVATVDENGVVTATNIGTADITFTSGEQVATCHVTVCDTLFDLSNKSYSVAKPASAEAELGTFVVDGYTMNRLNIYNNAAGLAYLMFGTKALETSENLLSNKTSLPNPITKIVFKTTSSASENAVYNAVLSNAEVTSPVTDDTNTLTGKGSLVINVDAALNLRYFAISCTSPNYNGQIESIEITYGIAEETIGAISTRSTLAYKYETSPSLSITAAAIRFGGMVSQTLWDRLNGEQTIQGYGMLLTTKEYLDNNGGQLSALYNAVDGSNVKKFDHAVAVMPDEANAAQKGELVGTYYIWNLFKNVPLNALTVEYVSVAYIRTASGVVFFNQAVASVNGLADAMLETPEYNNGSYDGSLKFLSDLN